MTDFPQPQVLPIFLSSISALYAGPADGNSIATANFATYNWPAQNQAVYIPMEIPWPYPVNRVFWCNGSSAGGNNDFGIYSMDGARIFHTGATAQSGTNQHQYVAPATPFVLSPGSYYFALSYDNATLTNRSFGFSTLATNEGKISGLFQQASAAPLPETATFATWASTGVPLIGVTRTASGF